ncbi:hypothetical protein Golob_004194 [Gossypium lobatum]|uniref:Uncharacterized protein n=1 Tax=Gossypium lobatum TaxID=34289 RepID=A0A7J8N0Y0_9ROSI|nr:hypothetical protein [Gossypium lobatum]
MQRIDISRNSRLMGQLPEFPINNTLEVLSLTSASFSGSIPASIAYLGNPQRFLDLSNMSLLIGSHNKSRTFPQLETLQLSSCNLIEFPEFIKSQNKLTSLDLSNNRFHDLVPNWLWKSTLGVLDLSSNAIDIPNQFPFDDVNSSFPMLSSLRLRYCNISTFPAFLKSQ